VRWSARRKQEVVLRLLRGEGLDALARETGQAAGTISTWREAFLAGGAEHLKSRPRPVEDRQLADAQRRSVSWRWTTTSCGRCWRRSSTALAGRGAERRRTA
jgi:transposase